MSSSQSKRHVNRERWFDRIESCKQSGLTQKAFCEQHRIGIASFRRWRAIFIREGKAQASPTILLPVNIIPAVSGPSLALWFGEELRLEIPPGFDPVMLKQVVEALHIA